MLWKRKRIKHTTSPAIHFLQHIPGVLEMGGCSTTMVGILFLERADMHWKVDTIGGKLSINMEYLCLITTVLAWSNVTDVPSVNSVCPSSKGHIPGVHYRSNNRFSPPHTSWSWHPSNVSQPSAPQKPFLDHTCVLNLKVCNPPLTLKGTKILTAPCAVGLKSPTKNFRQTRRSALGSSTRAEAAFGLI